MQARFVQDAKAMDYTPTNAVSAGDVVVLGNIVGVAKLDIPANKLGAIALTGAFEVEKDANAINQGAIVYWNTSSHKAQAASASSNVVFMGIALSSAASNASNAIVSIVGANGAHSA